METAAFIEALRADGELMADVADRVGWGAEVPTCPEWRMRDLVGHMGAVHRWAAGFVAGATEPKALEGFPADEYLSEWFREGHRALVEGLTTAPADRECWTFLAAPSPIAFWARRQAHETAMHRVDAESALGLGPFASIGRELALDGIDELVSGFHTRANSRVRSDTPCTLRIRAVDGPQGGDWLLRLSQEPPEVDRTATGTADCTVSGPAEALYLALWNRSGYEELEVSGDPSLLELWQRTSAI